MNKAELVSAISKKITNLHKHEIAEVVNAVFQELEEALKNGERVTLTGFGSWQVISTKGRNGRNPKTGEAIWIKEKKKLKWNSAKTLQDILND